MIQLPEVALAKAAQEGLRAYQAEVDAAGAYAARVAAGKREFERRNHRGSPVFDEVKRALEQMCSGAIRCAYCEDSRADEVEHVRPKDLYPEVVFSWGNYVYACGPCNGPKRSHFGVFAEGRSEVTELARKQGAEAVEPIAGDPVLIDPRTEDATSLMVLDLRDTFMFTASSPRGTRNHERAEYTIRILRLNLRPELARARREAYGDYLARLLQYQRERDGEASPARLDELREGIRQHRHPTVWREMQRQREHHPELRAPFAAVPETGAW